jgi:hypothetical protein
VLNFCGPGGPVEPVVGTQSDKAPYQIEKNGEERRVGRSPGGEDIHLEKNDWACQNKVS